MSKCIVKPKKAISLQKSGIVWREKSEGKEAMWHYYIFIKNVLRKKHIQTHIYVYICKCMLIFHDFFLP